MTVDQGIFCVIMISAIALFVQGRVRVDVIGILIILALAITKIISLKDAFSGFSSEPAIIVCAVFVLSAGLTSTGVTDIIGSWVGRWSGSSELRVSLVVMIAVAFMSAFTHHLMITAMMLPIVMKICRDQKVASSRILIPMATAASLGTTLTLIGAPAFLLANNILVRSGEPTLRLFSIAKVGAPVVASSILLILLLRWLLPKRSGVDKSDDRFLLSEISTELVVPEGSKWDGKTIGEMQQATAEMFKTFAWQRNRRNLSLHHPDLTVHVGDVLLVKTNSDELLSMDGGLGLVLKAINKYGDQPDAKSPIVSADNRVFQALIAPQSPLRGRTLAELNFFHRYGVVAVGIWRKSGWMEDELSEVVLQEGDLVVMWGPEDRLTRLARHRGFLLFMPFQGSPVKRHKRGLAAMIMILSVVTAAMAWLPAYVAFVAGALAMVVTGCVSHDDAYGAIETKIFIMIAGVIPLGIAMEKTGFDKIVADGVLGWTQGWSPLMLMMLFFWFAALLTQILSDAATTVLVAPIALAFAKATEISPTAAVVTVTMGAVASFLTPIGHHGNLLVLGPGGYSFGDFLKIGLPLTVVISVLTCFLSLTAWP